MKAHITNVAFLSLLAVGCAATTLSAVANERSQLTSIPASDIAFDNMFPGPGGGPKIATVSGDRNRGAHISLVRFPPGMVSPLHTHSYESEGLVISGVLSNWQEDETQASAKPLPSGSYFKEPAMLKHYTACAPGAECLIAVFQKGKWDGTPVDLPKATN